MKNYEEVKYFVNNSNGIMRCKEFIQNKISKYYIKKLVEDGILEKYSRGIYVRKDIFEDEFYILQQKNEKIIYSYNTALYFLNETEITPEIIDVTVYNGYNVHNLPKDVRIHYVPKNKLHLGVIEIQTPQGFKVKSYNLERTMCDIIKSKNTGIDKEQKNKFIKKMFFENKIDISVLVKYSKKLKCENKVREIIDILV